MFVGQDRCDGTWQTHQLVFYQQVPLLFPNSPPPNPQAVRDGCLCCPAANTLKNAASISTTMCFCSKVSQQPVDHRPQTEYKSEGRFPPTILPLSLPGSTSVVGVHGTIISQSLSDVVYNMRLFVCACVCICLYVKNAYTKTGMLSLTPLWCTFMDIL